MKRKIIKLLRTIFCMQITWWFLLFVVLITNVPQILANRIGIDWYLWLFVVFVVILGIMLYKSYKKCKRLVIEDYFLIGVMCCIGLLFCFASPLSDMYPKESLERFLSSLIAFGPIIIGFVSFFFVCTQVNISKRQKNISLFEKRWDCLNQLRDKYYNIGFCKFKTVHDIEESEDSAYYQIARFKIFSEKIEILFNREIKSLIDQTITNLEKRLQILRDLYLEEMAEHQNIDEINRLYKEQIEIEHMIEHGFEILYTKMLEFIKKEEL